MATCINEMHLLSSLSNGIFAKFENVITFTAAKNYFKFQNVSWSVMTVKADILLKLV